MVASDIVAQRLYNQRIATEKFERPDQAAAWFGAMQAQDYAGVKWAVGLRCHEATEAVIEQAVTDKTIIRAWLMRGTLQITAASDIRWLLALLGPRLIAQSARRYRQLELDEVTFVRSAERLTEMLQGGKQVTRAEILSGLKESGVSPAGQRGYHILRCAGLAGLICFGPIQNKQETFVLLDEWVPHGRMLAHDEALAELARRYFGSHGPATLPDFVWWSGLKVAEARAGLEMAKTRLHSETIGGQTYWMAQNHAISKDSSPTVYLLPAFDEYYLGYQEREAVLDPQYDKGAVSSNGVFRPMIIVDGQIVGIWKRKVKKGSVSVTPTLFRSLTKAENQALLTAVNQYGAFLGTSAVLAS